MVKRASLAFGFIGVLLTALPFIQTNIGWIRVFDFPRLKIAVFCLVSLILLCWSLELRKSSSRIFILLVTAAFLYQCSLIIEFTPLYPVEAPSNKNAVKGNSFSILQANIIMSNRRADSFLKLVEQTNADIVSVKEPDAWWEERLQVLDATYPYSIKEPLSNTDGMILYSKFPLIDAEINYLVDEDVPSFYAKVLLPSGTMINLHCVHPQPPKPGSSTYERDTELFIVGRRIRREQAPSIVVGDLNDVAWSRTTKKFKQYSGMLDPRRGRGLYNTFNVNWPLLRYPLDHIFYTNSFRLNGLRKWETLVPITFQCSSP